MRLNRGKTPERIVDELALDGGWLTTAGVADLVGAREVTVDRALWRLLKQGLVERRLIPRPGRNVRVSEWRVYASRDRQVERAL